MRYWDIEILRYWDIGIFCIWFCRNKFEDVAKS
jgi:hypothetical protein